MTPAELIREAADYCRDMEQADQLRALADSMEARGKQEPVGYQELFKAIAAATSITSAGISVSVKAFTDSIGALFTHAGTGEVSSLKREVAALKAELVVKTAQVERLQEAGLSVIACEREELKSRIIGMEGQLTAAIYNANLYDRERNEANAQLSAIKKAYEELKLATTDYPQRIQKLFNTINQPQEGKYNAKQIAWELERTAMNDGFYGNALRVAKDFDCLDAFDRSCLDRYATGQQQATDHLFLQGIAYKIYNHVTAPAQEKQ